MNKSESIAKLADALAKAQGQVRAAVKGNINPHFKSKYADLGAVFDACREALSKNGIAVSQVPSIGGETNTGAVLVTILMHSSGEWLSGEYPLLPVKNDPQGFGSALTYARRYSLSSMVGIAADEDDDNAASAGRKEYVGATPPSGNGQYITEKQCMELETLADEVKANKGAFLEYLKAGSFATIPASQYAMALAALKKKAAAA